jgi:hypothetical protein
VDRDQGEGLRSLADAGANTSVLDVTSQESINNFKTSQLKDEPLDLLLNIAGRCTSPYLPQI